MIDPADTARNRTVLVSREQAAELLKFMHGASWPGTAVTRIAPVIEQLETLVPPELRAPSSSSNTER